MKQTNLSKFSNLIFKIFLKFFLLATLLFLNTFYFLSFKINNSHFLHANATNITNYAKVKANCLLLKTADITNLQFNNVYFEIPETYFVTILSQVDNSTLKVRYGNIVGYVDISNLTMVNLTPKQPTLEDIYFNIKPDAGTQIRTSPDATDNSNILTTIPSNAQNIKYIAKINATIPTGGVSDIWYYAEYTPSSNPTSVYSGYIYIERTTNLTNIPTNLEADVTDFNTPSTVDNTDEYVPISSTLKIVLIVLICLPILIVFISILLKHKRNKKLKNTNSENLALQNTSSIPNSDNSFNNTFLGNKPQLDNQENIIKRKSIKAFKDKKFSRVDNFKTTLEHISSKTTSSGNYKINLDALDDDELL